MTVNPSAITNILVKVYSCHWDWCSKSFLTANELDDHVWGHLEMLQPVIKGSLDDIARIEDGMGESLSMPSMRNDYTDTSQASKGSERDQSNQDSQSSQVLSIPSPPASVHSPAAERLHPLEHSPVPETSPIQVSVFQQQATNFADLELSASDSDFVPSLPASPTIKELIYLPKKRKSREITDSQSSIEDIEKQLTREHECNFPDLEIKSTQSTQSNSSQGDIPRSTVPGKRRTTSPQKETYLLNLLPHSPRLYTRPTSPFDRIHTPSPPPGSTSKRFRSGSVRVTPPVPSCDDAMAQIQASVDNFSNIWVDSALYERELLTQAPYDSQA